MEGAFGKEYVVRSVCERKEVHCKGTVQRCEADHKRDLDALVDENRAEEQEHIVELLHDQRPARARVCTVCMCDNAHTSHEPRATLCTCSCN